MSRNRPVVLSTTGGKNLYEAIPNNPGYVGSNAPRSLQHRYIFEDVAMSLVPSAKFGRRFRVATVSIEAMIRLAPIIHGTDYQHRGRTLEWMGLERLSVREILTYVETGERP